VSDLQGATQAESVSSLLDSYASTSDTLAAATIGTSPTAFAGSVRVPANKVSTDRSVWVDLMFLYSTSAATVPTFSFDLLWGGVTLATVTLVISASTTTRVGHLRFRVHGGNAPGSSVGTYTALEAATYRGTHTANNLRAQPVALNTARGAEITCVLTYSNNTAGNSATLLSMRVSQ
jgi:hypothetical protein